MTKEVMEALREKIMVMEASKEDNVNGGCTRTNSVHGGSRWAL
jgi:hypothetical protein